MEIQPGIQYDRSSDGLLGFVDLPGHSGRAAKALVFMLAGLTVRWKQTVAYFMTGVH